MRQVIEWSREYSDWQEAFAKVEAACGHYFWAHTINNAAIVLLSLRYGKGDYAKSIAISVMTGWDTDCSGAKTLPQGWTAQLNNTIHSAVFGFDNTKITDLAERSFKTFKKVQE